MAALTQADRSWKDVQRHDLKACLAPAMASSSTTVGHSGHSANAFPVDGFITGKVTADPTNLPFTSILKSFILNDEAADRDSTKMLKMQCKI
jgi:hypothetical protein